ncbi:hypothetical protein [Nonomuraea diastatica]|uniref:SH3 domain-containing protein n=1 Tax=Nonomuraea diastatica TaxID=1848329 RepID=A0A4R4WKP5_9ACTN|nr:hypothetical protein [Nonomuraea diastatica]TDD17003.1 hypothetical protein E1294_29240 [Nonomuraea diastatica]
MHIKNVTMAGALTGLVMTGVQTQSAEAGDVHDFGALGVVIWSEPRAGSGRAGVGYAGQGFESDRSEEHGLYRCDFFESTLWHHGRNVATGVVGWVPACNLTDSG